MEQLRTSIIKLINESGLPAEGVYYIIKDVFRDVEESYRLYLNEKVNKDKEENQNSEE